MKNQLIRCTALSLILGAGLTCQAGLLVNGSFEDPLVAAGSYLNIVAGGEGPAGFTGWAIDSGNIDIVNVTAPLFGIDWSSASPGAATDGSQILDLNGTAAGAISQVFATTAGVNYTYSFWYANNPLGGTGETMQLDLVDVTTSDVLHRQAYSHSSSSMVDPDWAFASGSFTASGNLTRLVFASTSNIGDSSGGIVLDSVNVVETVLSTTTPEPSTLVLSAVAMLAALAVVESERASVDDRATGSSTGDSSGEWLATGPFRE